MSKRPTDGEGQQSPCSETWSEELLGLTDQVQQFASELKKARVTYLDVAFARAETLSKVKEQCTRQLGGPKPPIEWCEWQDRMGLCRQVVWEYLLVYDHRDELGHLTGDKRTLRQAVAFIKERYPGKSRPRNVCLRQAAVEEVVERSGFAVAPFEDKTATATATLLNGLADLMGCKRIVSIEE